MERYNYTCCSIVLIIIILGGLGCARSNRASVLESQLRRQEKNLADLQYELEQSQAELNQVRKQAEIYRQQIAADGGTPLLPEQTNLLARAEKIQFQKLLTGGYDEDGIPGDELLSAVIVPVDAQGDLVKLPGAIQLEVIDPNQPDEQRVVGSWEFTERECREVWLTGLVGAGYFFKLPWQKPPTSSELLVHAHLTSVDGREFTTSQLIRVQPQSNDPNAVPPPTPLTEVLQDMEQEPPTKQARFENAKDEIPAEFFENNRPDETSDFTPRGQIESEIPFKPAEAPIRLERDGSISTSERWTDFNRPIVR